MSGVDMADKQADEVEGGADGGAAMGGLTVLDVADMKVVSAEVIAEAMSVIDAALSQMVRRELVSSGEVSDLLLDVRNLLTSAIR